MKKILILCFSILLMVSMTSPVQASEVKGLQSKYFIAVDRQTGLPLVTQNSTDKMYPASMTKVVTAIVALEKIEDLDKRVVIQQRDIDTIFETEASAAFFTVGETVTYRDLIYGLLLPSGADAARALAFNLSGSIEAFVDEMNVYVKDLGLKDTHFVNGTGIHDDNHYSTASDMATIVATAIKNPDFLEAFSSFQYTSSNRYHDWVNTGMFYSQLAGENIHRIIGCKSGFTDEAQACLASLVDVNGREVIMVSAFGDKDIKGVTVQDVNTVANYLNDQYQEVTLVKKGETIDSLPVKFAKDLEKVEVLSTKDVSFFLPKDTSLDDVDITSTYDKLVAPIQKGQSIGTTSMTYNDQVLYQQDIVASKDITRDAFGFIVGNAFGEYWMYTAVASISFVVVVVQGITSYKRKRKS